MHNFKVGIKCSSEVFVCEVRYKRTTFIYQQDIKNAKKLQLSRLSRFFTSRVSRIAYIVIISTGCAVGCYTLKARVGAARPPSRRVLESEIIKSACREAFLRFSGKV